MNLVFAFALGALLGGAAVAAAGWHLLRSARAAWKAEQEVAITRTAACEDLLDGRPG